MDDQETTSDLERIQIDIDGNLGSVAPESLLHVKPGPYRCQKCDQLAAENAKLKEMLADLEAAADSLVEDVWGSLVSLATVRKSRLYESEENDE